MLTRATPLPSPPPTPARIRASSTRSGGREHTERVAPLIASPEWRRGSSMDQCKCNSLHTLAVIDMGNHEAIFQTFERVRERGAPYWWLYASECRVCKTLWVVAQEERQNDIFILRRLEPPADALLLHDNVWPPDFERYEALLEIGRDYGRAVRFAEPGNSSLLWTMADLAKE